MESTLLQVGVTGAVLLWFMLRAERRLDAMVTAQDRMRVDVVSAQDRTSRAMLLLVLQIPNADDHARQQARSILAEIERHEHDEQKRSGGA